MLIEAADVSGGTPVLVLVLGALGSAAAVIFGAFTLWIRVRQARDDEIKERTENTNATNRNTEAIREFTASLRLVEDKLRNHDDQLAAHQRELEDHDRILDVLYERRPRFPGTG